MLGLFTKKWWTFTLRGIFAILFGVFALVWPGATIVALTIFFGCYLLADGIFAVAAGLGTSGEYSGWWTLVLEGLAGIILGLLTLVLPAMTAQAVVYMIGAWAVVTGVLELSSAIQLRRQIANEIVMILSGLISIILGLLLFAFPVEGAVSLVWLIGVFSLLFGFSLVLLSLRMRQAWWEFNKDSN